MDATTKKLEDIESFFESRGIPVADIVKSIKRKTQEISRDALSTIDVLFESTESLQIPNDENVIIHSIKILGRSLSLTRQSFPIVGISSQVLLLVDHFQQNIFRIGNLNIMSLLEPKVDVDGAFELADMAERFGNIDCFLTEQKSKENLVELSEPALEGIIADVDIHIGVDEIGILKHQIERAMCGAEDQIKKCFNYLKIFVRVCTFRHLLLFRLMNCLATRHYSPNTVNTLTNYIEEERVNNQIFLKFFSLPTLENAQIVAAFEPSEHKELAAYLREMRLPLQDLRELLHDRVFLIKSFQNPHASLVIEKSISSSTVTLTCTKGSLSSDNKYFKFIAKENSFNLFYMQSLNSDNYVYVDENTCKHGRMTELHQAAQWRVMQVHKPNSKGDRPSCFVIGAKQQRNSLKFVYLKKDRKWLGDNSIPNEECLFEVSIWK